MLNYNTVPELRYCFLQSVIILLGFVVTRLSAFLLLFCMHVLLCQAVKPPHMGTNGLFVLVFKYVLKLCAPKEITSQSD